MPKIDGSKLPILKLAELDRPRVPFYSELHSDGVLICKGKEKRLPGGLAAEIIHEAGVGRVVVRVWYSDQLWYAWLTHRDDLKKAGQSDGQKEASSDDVTPKMVATLRVFASAGDEGLEFFRNKKFDSRSVKALRQRGLLTAHKVPGVHSHRLTINEAGLAVLRKHGQQGSLF
jgi:hypothetical protein